MMSGKQLANVVGMARVLYRKNVVYVLLILS